MELKERKASFVYCTVLTEIKRKGNKNKKSDLLRVLMNLGLPNDIHVSTG